MLIKFDSILRGKAGAPLKDGDREITLAYCAELALFATFQDEQVAGDVKAKNARLALRIEGETDVSPEEIVTIKERIGKAFGPLVVARCWELLDGGERAGLKSVA